MRQIIIIAVILLMTAPKFIYAAESAVLIEMFDMLLENGMVNERQHGRLIQALNEDEEISNESKQPNTQVINNVKVKTKGGLEVSSDDDAFSFELGGRLMMDTVFYNEDLNKLGDGTELRRARLEVNGKLYHDWLYELGIDFADGDADIKDAYIAYKGWSPLRLKLGHFKEPFSLEEQTSSKYITFMERALPTVFSPGRNIGVGAYQYWDHITIAGGLFGEDFNDDASNEGNEGWGGVIRLTYAPIYDNNRVIHLGFASEYRQPDDDRTISFDERPESHITDTKFVNTGDIVNVNDTVKYGLEAASVWGPFSLQGEYFYTDVNRRGGLDDLGFNGWYGYGSWFLTGESRNYKFEKGGFGKIKPQSRYGAWELAFRYSTLDLNDGSITGGQQDNMTFGLNWYINSQIRAMANYIVVNNDANATDDGGVLGNDDPDIFQMRLQAHF